MRSPPSSITVRPRDVIEGVQGYGPDLVKLEPRHSPDTEQQRNGGRTLTEDDTRRIQNGVFDQMVSELLLAGEYRKRGIFVTDDEVREFARYAPPNWILDVSD